MKPGDKVEATSTKTGKTSAEKVSDVEVNHDTDLYDLKVKTRAGVKVIHATAAHLFWDPVKKLWVKAAKLKKGEHLKTANGTTATADGGTTPTHHDGWMWDLTIPGNGDHDFYVLPNGVTAVLAHNLNDEQCSVPGPQDLNWPNFRSSKTAATSDVGNTFTLSGWSSRIPKAFTRVPTAVTAGLRNLFGMAAKGSGNDLGVFGRYFDTHAERQAFALNPSGPTVVTRDPCANCQEFFSYAAFHNQQTYILSSPSGLWAFHPTGDMEFIPRVPYAGLEPPQ